MSSAHPSALNPHISVLHAMIHSNNTQPSKCVLFQPILFRTLYMQCYAQLHISHNLDGNNSIQTMGIPLWINLPWSYCLNSMLTTTVTELNLILKSCAIHNSRLLVQLRKSLLHALYLLQAMFYRLIGIIWIFMEVKIYGMPVTPVE